MTKPILPKRLAADPKKMARILVNSLNMSAKAVQVDFKVTTQTWEHKPTFAITSPSIYSRQVATDDAVYAMLNQGTKPHIIRPGKKRVLTWLGANYRPKSRPGFIGSNKGGNDNTIVYAKQVQHPGTVARAWSKAIKAKWDRLFAQQTQRAIDSEH